jgi:hypothetical protein
MIEQRQVAERRRHVFERDDPHPGDGTTAARRSGALAWT